MAEAPRGRGMLRFLGRLASIVAFLAALIVVVQYFSGSEYFYEFLQKLDHSTAVGNPPAEPRVTETPASHDTVQEPTTSQTQPPLAPAAPDPSFRDCGAECPQMISIPTGQAIVGSAAGSFGHKANEGPTTRVTITRPFAVSAIEITRGQFKAFVTATNREMPGSCYAFDEAQGKYVDRADRNWLNPGYDQSDEHPAVCVSWDDATAYVAWLSAKTGHSYRLLSEAEWEYAARANSTGVYPWGDNARDACRYANVRDASFQGAFGKSDWKSLIACDDGVRFTSQAGSKSPNAFGLYDMIGNAYEYVGDCWSGSHDGMPADGSPVLSGDCSQRVYKGGGYGNGDETIRPAARSPGQQFGRSVALGFRVARDLFEGD